MRDGLAADAAGIERFVHDPDALLEAFDGEEFAFVEAMLDGKAAGAPFDDGGFDVNGVVEG